MLSQEEVFDIGVDAAAAGFFTTSDLENRNSQMAYFADDLEPGSYRVLLVRSKERLPALALFIDDEYADRVTVDTGFEYEELTRIELTGNLYLSDPYFILEDAVDESADDGAVITWRGPAENYAVFEKFVEARGFTPQPEDRARDTNPSIEVSSVELGHRLINDFHLWHRDRPIQLAIDLHPNSDVCERLFLNQERRVDWTADNRKQSGVSMRSGWGDGFYPVYRLKWGDRVVGYMLEFIDLHETPDEW